MQITVELWAGKQVEVQVEGDIIVTLDGQVLEARIVEWAIAYGFRQGIRDAGAAEKTDELRNAKAEKRIHALVTNTLREGSSGGKVTDPVQREVIALATAEVRAATENPANAAWVAKQRAEGKLSLSELREAMLKPYIEKHKERLTSKANANIAERMGAAGELDLDLNAA